MNKPKENRLELLEDKEYRKNLKNFYLIEIASCRSRHDNAAEDYDVCSVKESLRLNGIVCGIWTCLADKQIYPIIQNIIDNRKYSQKYNGNYFVMRIRVVKSVNTDACKDGDAIVLESHITSPGARILYPGLNYDLDGDFLFIDQTDLEPISDFERKFLLEEEREETLKKLEELQKEMKIHEEKFQSLKAKYDSLGKNS